MEVVSSQHGVGNVFKLSFVGGRSCCCVYCRLERTQMDLACCYSSPGDWRLGHGVTSVSAALVIDECHTVSCDVRHVIYH